MEMRNTNVWNVLVSGLLGITLVGLTACGGSGGGGDDDAATLSIDGRIETSPDFQEVVDPQEQQALVDELWTAFSAPQCWDSSYIGDPTIGGTPGGVSQLSFYGAYEYRYVGFETWVGAVRLFSVGYYKGFKTAILSTWTDEVEALILLSDSHVVHVTTHLDGSLIAVEFGASDGPCL